MLKLTFTDGTSKEFPFHSGSQLTVATPDGVNGLKYGSWGEIAHLELVEADAVQPAPAPVEAPVAEAPATAPALEPVAAADEPELTAPLPEVPDNAAPAPEAPAVVVTDSAAGEVASATPAEAVEVAALLPTDDALKHIEAALVRWPDDQDLLAAQADLETPAA